MKKMTGFALITILITAISCRNASKESNKSAMGTEHVVVYHEDGRFAGWPANNGFWVFADDEILVGFIEAEYELGKGHNAKEPYLNWLARSKDGGMTFDFQGWMVKPFHENETNETSKVALTDNPENNLYATQCRAVMS